VNTSPDTGATAATLRDSVLMGAAITVIALAFIASYVGALHDPSPTRVPVAVSAQVPLPVEAALRRSRALHIMLVASPHAAVRAIDLREAYAALTASPSGFTVVTAPAASYAIAEAMQAELRADLRATHRPVGLVTIHPLPARDIHGVVGFYVVVGWVIAGYLGATLFGITFGTRITRRGTTHRLGALLGVGMTVGLGGMLLAKAIGHLPGPWLSMTLLGGLIVGAVGATTVAMQLSLGVPGTGIAIVLFVILGNPSSGGPAAPELLPGFWRQLGPLLPNGTGVTALRDVAYFPAASIVGPLGTLFAWGLVGSAIALALGERGRGSTNLDAEVEAEAIAGLAP
jgi:hypothetical protein